MQTIDDITGKLIPISKSSRILIEIAYDQLIWGYTQIKDITTIKVFRKNSLVPVPVVLTNKWKKDLFYSNKLGIYISKLGVSKKVILEHQYTFGIGNFPYTFKRNYEAIESFKIFNNKQTILKQIKSPLSKHLKYSFGLEFETAAGYVPQDICFRDGLIPLRDGSISGLEYSTVILKGNPGISLLKQQVETLKQYTIFDKECSLHIHMGGFPLDPQKIYRLYLLCYYLEPYIATLTPCYTFNTAQYKKTGKDYCKHLPYFNSFEELYKNLVGKSFLGDLCQNHPNDLQRQAKWRIRTRYYSVNFINLLCYNVNKTIEFRFLRPTYNFSKILLWLYIFNAILIYAETYEDINTYGKVSLEDIIRAVYPKNGQLLKGIDKLEIIKSNLNRIEDYIGEERFFEDLLFSNKVIY